MANVDPAQIRNLVLMSHGGAGKTSLTEALASAAGAITRLGRVEDGNTIADFDPDEQKRGMSVNTAVVSFDFDQRRINLIDTPGYADFIGEVHAGALAADVAVILVDAGAGVQVGTEVAWRIAAERGMPRLVVVNRLDRENANWSDTTASIQSTLGRQCSPLHLPIGAEADFDGLVDILSQQAYRGDGKSPTEIPGDLADAVRATREALIERIAEADEDLTLKYLEGDELTEDEIRSGLKQAILTGTLVPILAAATTKGIGTRPLLRLIADNLPSPIDVGPVAATVKGAEGTVPVDLGAPPAAIIFRTSADEFVGRLSYFRVFAGVLKSDSHVWNAQKGEPERLGHLSHIFGKELQPVDAIGAGDIGAVTKLSLSTTFDTLSAKDHPVILPPPQLPTPVFFAAIEPKTKADVDKLGPSLQRLLEEDLTLRMERDQDTGQTLISGLGESHVALAADKLHSKFKVNVEVRDRKVPYRETITTMAQAEYLHKKQTGGHGQYARVALRVEPRRRGKGFSFDSKIVGGAVPRQYIPAVEKGVHEALPEGIVARYPLTDLSVVLYDGKHHDVDSSEMAFKLAASMALKEATQQARPILLEPILSLRIIVPDTATGDIMSDLNARRARVLGVESAENSLSTVIAEGPMAEFLHYAADLRSLTGGRGTFSSTFDRYDSVPEHAAKKVVERAKREAEAPA